MSIQGQLLEVTVVGCNKLKDTEWISRQDPYVILEYATTKFRTRTCTDGGRNPSFQEKTALPLIEGLREISVSVWNSNSVSHDDFIGSGRVQLSKVLAQGYDDSCWSIQSRSGRYSETCQVCHAFKLCSDRSSVQSSTAVRSSIHAPKSSRFFLLSSGILPTSRIPAGGRSCSVSAGNIPSSPAAAAVPSDISTHPNIPATAAIPSATRPALLPSSLSRSLSTTTILRWRQLPQGMACDSCLCLLKYLLS